MSTHGQADLNLTRRVQSLRLLCSVRVMSTLGFHGLVRGTVCAFHVDGQPQVLRVLVPPWATPGLTVWVKKDKVRVSVNGGEQVAEQMHTLSRVGTHQVKFYVVSEVGDVLRLSTPVKEPVAPVAWETKVVPVVTPPCVVVNGVTLTDEQVNTVCDALRVLNKDVQGRFASLSERGQRDALGGMRRSNEVLRLISVGSGRG